MNLYIYDTVNVVVLSCDIDLWDYGLYDSTILDSFYQSHNSMKTSLINMAAV